MRFDDKAFLNSRSPSESKLSVNIPPWRKVSKVVTTAWLAPYPTGFFTLRRGRDTTSCGVAVIVRRCRKFPCRQGMSKFSIQHANAPVVHPI
eukprot:scaffold2031_cov318-Pavlova_lutheri.AAC.1